MPHQTFRHDGEDLPLTDDVLLTAVGLLDQFHDDVESVVVESRDSFVVRYDGRTASLSPIELVALAHTHNGDRWTDAVDALDLDPVDDAPE